MLAPKDRRRCHALPPGTAQWVCMARGIQAKVGGHAPPGALDPVQERGCRPMHPLIPLSWLQSPLPTGLGWRKGPAAGDILGPRVADVGRGVGWGARRLTCPLLCAGGEVSQERRGAVDWIAQLSTTGWNAADPHPRGWPQVLIVPSLPRLRARVQGTERGPRPSPEALAQRLHSMPVLTAGSPGACSGAFAVSVPWRCNTQAGRQAGAASSPGRRPTAAAPASWLSPHLLLLLLRAEPTS